MDCNYWVLYGCVSQLEISSFDVELTFFLPKKLAYQQTNKRNKAFRFSSRPRCLSNLLELNKYEARVDCLAMKHVL